MNIRLVNYMALKLLRKSLIPFNSRAYLMIPTMVLRSLSSVILHELNCDIERRDVRDVVFAFSKYWINISHDGFVFITREGGDLSVTDLMHEPHVSPIIIDLIRRSRTFVDIGAHIGTYTVRAPKLMRGSPVILAFEPYRSNFSLLKKNMELNYTRIPCSVEIFNLALGSYDGYVSLYGPQGPDPGFSGHLSTNPEFIKRAVDARKICDVKVARLDGLPRVSQLETIDFMKIDVEGAELGILEGAKGILMRVKNVLVETIYPDEVCSLLHEFGFNVCTSFHGGFYLHLSRR